MEAPQVLFKKKRFCLLFLTKFLLIESRVRHSNLCLVFPDCFVALVHIQNCITKEGFLFPACKIYLTYFLVYIPKVRWKLKL